MSAAAKTAAVVQDTVASHEAVATQGIFDSLVGTSAQVGTAAQGTGAMQGLVTAKRIVDS
ncbi:hypothetical protein PF010_g22167 [Phytophthora fragariae]|uniref:Uncharacterized protein n=1 Tax=Phytophthora fragariae TaxID=53985 RepID=A0A6G0K9D6_9STRA|nr:hypothetical protein PF010_g22167 [Phytophthora fragariae]